MNKFIKPINSETESKIEKMLESIIKTYNSQIRLRTKISIKDVLVIPKTIDENGDEKYTYYLRAHFDFLICSIYDIPLFAIEYDDPSHGSEDAKRRDRLKNYLCNYAEFKLIRIPYWDENGGFQKVVSSINDLDCIKQFKLFNLYTIKSPISSGQTTKISIQPTSSRFKAFEKAFYTIAALVTVITILAMLYNFNVNPSVDPSKPLSKVSYKNNTNKNQKILSFVVGRHPNARGTYIEVNDGAKTIISDVYSEGFEFCFYKDKTLILINKNSDTKKLHIENNIINIEVANSFTKIFHNGQVITPINKFKYDFTKNEIIEK